MTSAISLFVEKTSPRQDSLSSLPGMKLLHNPCDAACHRARPDPAFALSRCACDSGSRQEMEPLVLVDDDGLDVIDPFSSGLACTLRAGAAPILAKLITQTLFVIQPMHTQDFE